MTWHHVALVLIAAGLTMGVILSANAKEAIGPVFNLDGIVVAGVFGHAGAGILRRKLHAEKEDGHS